MIIRGDDRGEAEKNWTLVTNTLTFLSTSMYKRGKERWCTHYSIRFNPLAFRCVSPPLAVILLAPVCYSCIFFSFSYLIADTSHRLSERWCSCCRFRSRKRGSVWLTRGATTTTSPASHPSSSALSTSFFFIPDPFLPSLLGPLLFIRLISAALKANREEGERRRVCWCADVLSE